MATSSLQQDIRFGLRSLRKSPGFAAVVILTLALGIGANTAIFSVVYSVLLRPLPYPAGERLVRLGESTAKAEGISVTWVNYQHWRQENHSFEEMAAFEGNHLTLTGRDEPLLTRAGLVSSTFFGLIGARPVLGRVFTDEEDRPGAVRTAVLSHQFWTAKLGGDPKILGATLALNGQPYQVIGVLPPGPEFFPKPVDYYLPIGLTEGSRVNRAQHGSIRLLARLKTGVTLAAARADLDSILHHLAESDPGPENNHKAYGVFLADSTTSEIRPTLLILMAAVGLVLLLACANVASLLLARSTARAGEIAIRSAMGAGRARLIRQLFTENLLLAALGGIAGILLALACLRTLVGLAPAGIPRLAETALSFPVLLFASAATLLTGILAGMAPVWTAGKLDLATILKDISRTATGKSGQAFRSVLVVGEIAITLVLSFASALLLHSLILAQTGNPGFSPVRLLALELVLPSSSYKGAEATRTFYERLKQDLRTLPGVTAAGSVNCPPSAGDCGDWFYSIAGKPAPPESDVPISLFNVADSEYFRSIGIPIREGRGFNETDRAGAPSVAVVNETFARKWWPKESAVGHQIKVGGPYRDGGMLEIVGVAGDVSQMGLDTSPMPEIYQPFAQAPSQAMVVMIRTAGDPEALTAAVRRRLGAIDRNLPIESLQPFAKTLGATLERRRFATLLLALFAVLAMVLAAVGVYGLLNYWVSVREGNIAIRMALGAQRSAILGWVGRQALQLAAAGIVLGLLAGWAASHWLESLVFGVSARSPIVMAIAAIAVTGVTALAAAIPISRALRVDTVRTLHHS